MAWKVFYYVEVEADILFAKKWYKERQDGLEKKFIAEVKKGLIDYRKTR